MSVDMTEVSAHSEGQTVMDDLTKDKMLLEEDAVIGESDQDTLSSSMPETLMAEHNEVAYTTAEGNDYAAHEQTYDGFIMLVKYGTAAVIVILAMMAIFLT